MFGADLGLGQANTAIMNHFSLGKNPGACLFIEGLPRGFSRVLHGLQMHSILEILLVNVKEGTSKKSGQPYKISEAHCILRNDDGTAGAVGVLTVPKQLEEVARPGVFTAAFSLEAPTFGENAGKIIAALKGLVPVPPASFKRPPVGAGA
jgi:hypothetical protein